MDTRQSTRVLADGEVVEIFEQEGELHVKVVLSSPTVLDVSTRDVQDLHLGDQVVIDGSFTIGHIRRGTGQPGPDGT